MNWASGPGWNMQQSGDYAITKHAISDKPGSFYYIAYWHKEVLASNCPSADTARAVCVDHARIRS